MPEDDFDIYGEDDGFVTSKTEQVGSLLERIYATVFADAGRDAKDDDYQDEVHVEEPVEAVSTPVEPATGDKRPRLDEDEDAKPITAPSEPSRVHSTTSNRVASPATAHARPDLSGKGQGQDIAMNGSYHANGGQHAGGGGSVDPSTAGFDALYIGDLQWVRAVN